MSISFFFAQQAIFGGEFVRVLSNASFIA